MADAQINRIELLSSFAGELAKFSQSVTSNSTAFVNLITEKLSELRLMERKAEEICYQLTEQRKQLFHDYAAIAGYDDNVLHNKSLVLLQDAEEKERIANRCLATIHQNVGIAHSAVITMIDCTKQFEKSTTNEVEKGLAFLKKSQTTLEQYKKTQKKL